MKEATLCFLVRDQTVWLAMKKRGFGKGKYNGYGGKLETGETSEDAMLRELHEETDGVRATLYEKVADNTYIFPQNPENNFHVHVYIAKQWNGAPTETDEMKPELFEFTKIPYTSMWHDDPYWLPQVLSGIKLRTYFEMTDTEILNKKIEPVDKF